MDPVSKAEAKNRLGNTYYDLKQYANAIQYYTQAITFCPQIAKYYANRSQCHINLYDFIKGLTDAKKCIELDNSNMKGYLRLVECSLSNGDLKYAETTINTAKGIFLNNKDIVACYERVEFVKKNDQLCQENQKKGKHEDALKNIENCLAKVPYCLNYQIKKSECLMNLKQYEKATSLIDEILKFKPLNEDAQLIKKCIRYRQTQQTDDVFNELVELRRKQPDHTRTKAVVRSITTVRSNKEQMEIEIKKGNYIKAYDLAKEAIKNDNEYRFHNKDLYLKKIDIAAKDPLLYWFGSKDCTVYMDLYGKDDLNMLKRRAQFYMDSEDYDFAKADYELIYNKEHTSINKNKLKQAQEKLEQQVKDDYKILKLKPNVKITRNDFLRVHQKLMLHYHVDKNRELDTERKKLLEAKVILFGQAKERILRKLK